MDAGFCAVDNDFDHFLSKSHEITSGFVNSYDYCNPREVTHITRSARPAYNSRNMSEPYHAPNFGEDFEIPSITPSSLPGDGGTPGMNAASGVSYGDHGNGGGGGGGGEPTFHTAGSPQQMSSLTSPLNPQQAANVPSPQTHTSSNSPALSQSQSPSLAHTMSPSATYNTTSLSNVTPSYSSQGSPAAFTDALSHMTDSLPVTTSSGNAPINPQFPPQMFDIPHIGDHTNMGHFGGMDPSAMGAATHMGSAYMSHHHQQQHPHHPSHQQQQHHPSQHPGHPHSQDSNFFHHPHSHSHTEMGPPHPPGPQGHLSTINHSQLGLGMHHGALPPMSQQHHASMMGGQTASPPAHMVPARQGHLESSEDSDDNTPLAQFAAQAKRPEVVKETKKKPPKRKRKKDPNEPQKPVSAYALFFRDTQAAIKGQNPNASFGEVSKIVASMWDSLDADQKGAYKQRTETAKKEYLKKLAAYRASLVSKAAGDQIDPEDHLPNKQQRLTGPSVSPPHGANMGGGVGQHPTIAPRVIAPKPPSSQPGGGDALSTAGAPSPYSQQAMIQPMQNIQRVVKPMSPPEVVPMSASQPRLCTRNGCTKLPIASSDWDNEYCSTQCVVDHCRDVFTGWVAMNSVSSGMVPPTVK